MFVVQIRHPKTHEPLPGVQIGDCGHKIGCDGIDNGWLIFEGLRVPRENLLNKFADVAEDGTYISEIKKKSQIFVEPNIDYVT